MSYIDEKWDEWYNVIGGPAVYAVKQTWQAENGETVYYANEYEDGWFSVDGDEWIGEFENRQSAEIHMGLAFEETDVYGGDHEH
ncbi:hypothetical protein SEA_ZOOMAN_59 [Microbacterium phage Zooman]|nr:hypothetical protein SEA_ZOOMAN_59 [Microbacterium phage Zooman]